MDEGQLIIKYVKSVGEVNNLKRKIEKLESDLKYTNEQLSLYDVMSSRILIEKDDLFKLIVKAINEGFNNYEVVEAGLESFDAKTLANYMISKYV